MRTEDEWDGRSSGGGIVPRSQAGDVDKINNNSINENARKEYI